MAAPARARSPVGHRRRARPRRLRGIPLGAVAVVAAVLAVVAAALAQAIFAVPVLTAVAACSGRSSWRS